MGLSWRLWYNSHMSEGGFLEGFDTASIKEEPTKPESSGFDVHVTESEVGQEAEPALTKEQAPITDANAGTTPVLASDQPAAAAMSDTKDQVYEEVASIVQDGIEQMTATMEPTAKERFLKKGQEITFIIASMVRGFHVKAKEVLRLLKEWILTIPGVNKFFLEQEVKIKTDRIVELEQVRKEESLQ